MGRNVKTKWTPEAEQRAAEMWNAQAPSEKIVLVLKSEFGVVVNAEGVHSLAKRRGAALGMIEGSDRRRAPRPDRVVNRKIKITKTGRKEIVIEPPVKGVEFMDLQAGQCRYPLTKSLPHVFCGEKTAHGSWCAKHFEAIKGKKS